jgi:hypothetical protein
MAQGPSLIFDKSSLESLNLDEAVMMDNFYMSTITPLFFVECLADLEKAIRSKSTPEQLVGSLANRTPDVQGYPNAHHLHILQAELHRHFDFKNVMGRVALAGGRRVQLGDKQGVVYQQSEEAEALMRWSRREFLEVERDIAKRWRRSLTAVDFKAMVTGVSEAIGPWRLPKSLADAKQIADTVINCLDPEFLLRFGLDLLGASQATEWVVDDWKERRRPNVREHVPYFVFLLTINIFFCLVLPTQLLRNVKASHQVDLAYLYYLPLCSVFTSKDNFHAQIVPLFLGPMQDFVNGIDFKEDMRRLVAHYSDLPEDVLKTGLYNYAAYPPEDDSFVTTRMWDKYLPRWRAFKDEPKKPRDPEADKRTIEELKRMSESPELHPEDEADMDSVDYVSLQRAIRPQKGKWLRFSEDQISRMRERGEIK